eukprot:c4668_g1_i1.p1 GENE.c4668_g1_i1~~c4668_g1_i1.p1  ORF type:complete len:485 (+),score=91.25 c4668_g1_i1:53-1456(+)
MLLEIVVTCFIGIGTLWMFLKLIVMTKKTSNKVVIGFFHPFCNDGGGGERVLWCAIKALQSSDFREKVTCVVFSGESLPASDILSNVQRQFNLTFDAEVRFVSIRTRPLLEPSKYPRFTLLLQTMAGLVVGLECLWKCPCDVFLDTTGSPCTMTIFKLFGQCRIGCYVHYPIITTEMLDVVASGSDTYNNDKSISSSALRTRLKVIYYTLFSYFYGLLGKCSDVTMVNSSWTAKHISSLWNFSSSSKRVLETVFPPCNTKKFQTLPLTPRQSKFVSIGQFRPEKNHALQLKAFALLLQQHPKLTRNVKLVLIGSCRHSNDQSRIDSLKNLAQELGIQHDIEWCVNAPFSVLLEHLSSAVGGLHTMWNEHFGIGVVELMAAGVIPIAHNSGGPQSDIVLNSADNTTRFGFLATTAEQYADCMWKVLDMTPDEAKQVQVRARQHAVHFSDEQFASQFVKCVKPLICKPF